MLPIKSEADECLIARRFATVQEIGTLRRDHGGQRLGSAELFHRAPHARRSLGHRRAVQIPLVARRRAFGRQLRAVFRLEVFEKIFLVRDEYLPLRRRRLLRDLVKMIRLRILLRQRQVRLPRLAVERVPAEAERTAHIVRRTRARRAIAAEKFGIGVEPLHGLAWVECFAVAAHVVNTDPAMPLHQHALPVRPCEPADLVIARTERDAARGFADATPAIPRTRPGPERWQTERQRAIFHRHRLCETQPVFPFELPRVRHAAQYRLRRLRAVARDERIHRRAEMAGLERRDHARELLGCPLFFVNPEPITAVEIEAVLKRRGLVLRLLREGEVKINHLLKHALIGRLIRRPHEVGVIIVRDVEVFLLRVRGKRAGGGNGDRLQGTGEAGHTKKHRWFLYPAHPQRMSLFFRRSPR